MKFTFASMKRLFRKPERAPEPPNNIVDIQAERTKRWLIKHTRPMPQKDPPEAAA